MGTPADLSKLKAVIDWGDATMPAAGTIASMGMGASTSYVVSGQHIYKDNGLYPVTVTITGGTPPSTSGMGTAQVAATPIQAAGTVITPVLGQPSPDLTVASFVDPNPFETVDDFVAFVDFGDGQTGAGTVVPDGNGRFRVTASHTYTSLPMAMANQPPAFKVMVSIAERGVPLTDPSTMPANPNPTIVASQALVIQPTFSLTAAPWWPRRRSRSPPRSSASSTRGPRPSGPTPSR